MKGRWVETTAWNGEWRGGDVIVAEDFGPEHRRCWKVQGLQKCGRTQISKELGTEEHRSIGAAAAAALPV